MSEDNDSHLLSNNADGKLRSIVERIERLNEDKAAVAADIKDVYAQAKGEGFDTSTIRKVIAIRKMDAAKRAETEALIELYLEAVGSL